jgi:Collagen triple helix repeat (20 copies)
MKKIVFFMLFLAFTRVGFAAGLSPNPVGIGNFFLGTPKITDSNFNQVLGLLVGPTGQPGVAGVSGANGKDGAPGTAGVNGLPGIAGINGVNGVDGRDGTPGSPVRKAQLALSAQLEQAELLDLVTVKLPWVHVMTLSTFVQRKHLMGMDLTLQRLLLAIFLE